MIAGKCIVVRGSFICVEVGKLWFRWKLAGEKGKMGLAKRVRTAIMPVEHPPSEHGWTSCRIVRPVHLTNTPGRPAHMADYFGRQHSNCVDTILYRHLPLLLIKIVSLVNPVEVKKGFTFWVAVTSAKNHKRQRRKRQSVTAKREKSQTPKVLTARLLNVT